MRRVGHVGLTAAIILALCACSGSRPDKRNEVRIALLNDPRSLSLIGNTDLNSSQLAALISDGLVAYDSVGRYVPMVAKSWELSPDGTTLTFHLRDGVLWHDGARVTSKDVAYTVSKVKDPATKARSWVSQFANVASIDTPDDLTAVVHFSSPYGDVLEPWRVPLIPEHVVSKDKSFLDGAFAQHPIGCGPFRFESYVPGQSVVVAAFDRYWGGRPALDRVILKIVSAERTGYESLLLRDLDFIVVSSDLWRESMTAPAGAHLARFSYYRLNAWKIDWNQADTVPYFKDKRVRRALVLALDRKRFVASVLSGLARPGVSSYPPESPWAEPSITALPFDSVESARLLDEAGWRVPSKGRIREKDGRPLSFTLLVPAAKTELGDRIAAWIQQSLAEVGVEMKIEKLRWEAFQERRIKHVFEAAMNATMFDMTPDRYDLYHSKAKGDGFNFGGFSDAEVDRLLEQGRATVDPAARREIYNRLQQRLDDLQPNAFVLQLASPVLHDAELEGVATSPVGFFEFAPGLRSWHWSSTRGRH